MSMQIVHKNDILLEEDINYILSLPEVIQAKKEIDSKSSGSVYFSVAMPASLKDKICENMGINVSEIPMRWIKGDTAPHIDRGVSKFDKTHLVYLTDNPGDFIIHDETYPISRGSAFSFQEGLMHKTVNTGVEPRLLLGPMSESGFAVGAATLVSGPGGSTIYFRYLFYAGIEYSYNLTTWDGTSWPVSIYNTNTAAGILNIEFTTDMTLGGNLYFQCTSDNIQFGSSSLNSDGTRRVITIDGVSNYPGFINNSFFGSTGYNNIYIKNLEINAINGSTLANNNGWIGQENFGKGASNNYIINCSSNGPISSSSGGIVGAQAGSESGASLTIIGCSSSGSMASGASGNYAGGIVGLYGGQNNGSIICQSCWTTGSISGNYSGGIVGAYAAYNSGNIMITNCYSTGVISGTSSGGIAGYSSGATNGTVTIMNCYTSGVISGTDAGGVAGGSVLNCNVSNSYSTGSINGSGNAGGIYGPTPTNSTPSNCYTTGSTTGSVGYIIGGSGSVPATCYSEADNASSEWNATNANNTLNGVPATSSVGTVWVSTGIMPYILRSMGYTPYSTTNISGTNLVRNVSTSVAAGSSTSSGIKTFGIFYAIMEITGGDSASYGSISINPSTGSISTGSSTAVSSYTVFVYNSGSYNITELTLNVTQAPTPTSGSSLSPVQRISFNQRSGFCGTRPVSSFAVGLGATRGKGSSTRMFNYCRNNSSSNNFLFCQLQSLGK